jgi:hypothetical protein
MSSSQLCTDYLPSTVENSQRKLFSMSCNNITLTLGDEAALIPRRTAIAERLHEREQKIAKDGGENE